MAVSPPLPPLGRIILPRGGFSGLFGALEHKKPRHTLQIVCHSLQDILCMRSLKPSVATSSSRKPPSYASASTLYQTARLADKIVELTLSLCELHPLLRLEHNSINQAVLKETSRVLLATITFIGKDTNALRKLSLLYQLGQYHRISTIGWRGNYALHQPLPIGQHVLFVSVAIVPAFAHPTSLHIHPWFATF